MTYYHEYANLDFIATPAFLIGVKKGVHNHPPVTSKKVHRLFEDGKDYHVFQRSQPDGSQ